MSERGSHANCEKSRFLKREERESDSVNELFEERAGNVASTLFPHFSCRGRRQQRFRIVLTERASFILVRPPYTNWQCQICNASLAKKGYDKSVMARVCVVANDVFCCLYMYINNYKCRCQFVHGEAGGNI